MIQIFSNILNFSNLDSSFMWGGRTFHDLVALEEIMKYRQHQYKENSGMAITGEDIQLVMDCDHCGPAVTECVRDDCDECGSSWVREDYVLCVIGNDVISLFPSLDSVSTGKIVRA